MASKSRSYRKSKVESESSEVVVNDYVGDILPEEDEKEKDLGVEKAQPKPYNNKVKLQSRISARVVVTGDRTVSGKRYEWERAGAIVEVDERDAPGLLEKRLGDKTCCGGSPDNLKVFILVE